MKPIKFITSAILAITFLTTLGCASSQQHESTGGYVSDSWITSKVKYAVMRDNTLDGNEINVETFKGVVQLSGFVSSEQQITNAVELANTIKGVKSVKNDMHLKPKESK